MNRSASTILIGKMTSWTGHWDVDYGLRFNVKFNIAQTIDQRVFISFKKTLHIAILKLLEVLFDTILGFC